jgi:hypothetical protein
MRFTGAHMQATICTDAMDKLYKELKARGVTMSALIAKACGVALAAHPRLWAVCTPDGAGITYNERINIANAVAMDGGLITPVLKDADTTDIYTLSRNWKVLPPHSRVARCVYTLFRPEEGAEAGSLPGCGVVPDELSPPIATAFFSLYSLVAKEGKQNMCCVPACVPSDGTQ